MSKHKRALCWIRRDLRLCDHAALAYATAHAEEVAVVFVYDTPILHQLPSPQDRRLTFIHRSLTELDHKLQNLGSRLITLHGDPVQEIPRLAEALHATLVVTAHDDDPYAIQRDQTVQSTLAETNKSLQTVKDVVVLERRQVLTNFGEAYKVFTPYSRRWQETVTPANLAPQEPDLSRLIPTSELKAQPVGNRPLKELGFEETDLWLEPGEDAAHQRLQVFLQKVDKYGQNRNDPAKEATSGLSVHLRFGTLSIRECFRAARTLDSPGARKWETELVWREFYHMILANFPHVAQGKTFRPEYNDLPWPGDPDHFIKWCEGQTGYPLVDAAMRCFNATGWMHNRLRMVVAMFLTKDLLIDWRKGEKYFADHLLDFDLASNNGGWQWSASTGVDAQPYFRIFNPISQSEKFDPQGTFIRQWCPELAELDNKQIHWPFSKEGNRTFDTPADYPSPIVLHDEQRKKALELFKNQPDQTPPRSRPET